MMRTNKKREWSHSIGYILKDICITMNIGVILSNSSFSIIKIGHVWYSCKIFSLLF